ncbi:hypothetical protein CGRA01v4_08556 [Colletotrichum graminicola]|nr:hypothetical protein CGRA01v4_08556 [Colletotrichum graminicola]
MIDSTRPTQSSLVLFSSAICRMLPNTSMQSVLCAPAHHVTFHVPISPNPSYFLQSHHCPPPPPPSGKPVS